MCTEINQFTALDPKIINPTDNFIRMFSMYKNIKPVWCTLKIEGSQIKMKH